MKKAPEKQELFLFSILALLVSLCHLSLIHNGSGNTAMHHPIPSFSPLKFR